ncbi:MAG TPA: cytochrome c oxidase assembly protein [Solirubrobacteraceae bacterium]|nr:cytochrome c oxidase assembly protein [Solirubrobacteraceae bacterium]
MSPRELALDWRLDGPTGAAFLVLVGAVACIYLAAARIGHQRDRRHRPWPLRRTVCFLAGLAVLTIDLYSGIGAQADVRLSSHMVEHMVMWVLVAPLLAAGAPVRLAFYALPRRGRRTLAGALRSWPVMTVTHPGVCVCVFCAVLLVTHLPPVYGLALSNDYAHELEHALYLVAALLVWVPILRADPLPHRLGTRGRLASMAGCMLPMLLIAIWLDAVSRPVYGHYLGTLGPGAVRDQHLAAWIMLVGGIPAFAVPFAGKLRLPARRRPALTPSVRVSA